MIKSILGGKSKNLFQSSDEVGVLNGGLGPNVARNFEENKWYIGLTSNNYYIPSNIKEYSIKDNLIYFKRDSVDSNGYGLARAIKCEPSIIYTLSFEPIYGAEHYAINIGYFDKDGNLISTNNIAGTSKTITTPNNCNWLVLVFNFYDIYGSGKGELYFGYIQIELGSTATEYVPHELTSYKSIMKVSDGRFVTSFDERMPCKTKNLFDINANSEKGYYDEQGNFYPTDRFLCFTIDVISNNTYCISTSKLGSVKGIVSFWNNNIFVSAVNYGEPTAFAYTVPSGANKLKFAIEANQKYSNIQLEKGTTATDYVPFGYV